MRVFVKILFVFRNVFHVLWEFCYALLAFLRCAVIGEIQGDERHLVRLSCRGHIRLCKERCIWNKSFLLGLTYLFTVQRHYLCLFIEKSQSINGELGLYSQKLNDSLHQTFINLFTTLSYDEMSLPVSINIVFWYQLSVHMSIIHFRLQASKCSLKYEFRGSRYQQNIVFSWNIPQMGSKLRMSSQLYTCSNPRYCQSQSHR